MFDDEDKWHKIYNCWDSGRAYVYLIFGLILAGYLITYGRWREAILVICFVLTVGAFVRWLSR